MSVLDQLFSTDQFTISRDAKRNLLSDELDALTNHHYARCSEYRNIIDSGFFDRWKNNGRNVSTVPFIPVRLFKTMDLKSIAPEDVIKVLTSSGTTGQAVSRIALDKETAMLQTKALVSIVSSYIGPKRLPMVIVDTPSIVNNRDSMSARGAGLVGLSNFGRDHFYALDDNMKLDVEGLISYVEKWKEHPVLIFGFTFMVWQYFIKELEKRKIDLSLTSAVLIHSGGWKKMEEQSVDNKTFKAKILAQCGIRSVYNFYGMVEQVGSIFMECDQGYFHTPNFAEIIIRNYRDWSEVPAGRQGVIQTLSVLPRSYPGHSLLTEDIGTIHGVDNCQCGRKGSYFTVEGRVPQAELRGCSDTHAESVRADQS